MSFSFVANSSRPAPPKPLRTSSSCGRRRRASKPPRKCPDGRKNESSKEVAERLKALKELIPFMGKEEPATADQLLEEAAEYILLLRTRVELLKHLVGSYTPAENNSVS